MLLVILSTGTAYAQGSFPGANEVAKAVIEAQTPRWVGPRVPFPLHRARPQELPLRARSLFTPIAIHAAENLKYTVVQSALQAAEFAYDTLQASDWRTPPPDGELGGGHRLDLYLVTGTDDQSRAHVDDPLLWSYLDRATVFATASIAKSKNIAHEVSHAIAEAFLLALDPAEAQTWRNTTATYLAQVINGEVVSLKSSTSPKRSWSDPSDASSTLAPWKLAWIEARHGRGDGGFIRGVWELSSQRTWEGEGLRASPDLWMALKKAVDNAGDSLLDIAQELAVMHALRAQRSESFESDVFWKTKLTEKAKRSPPAPAIGTFESTWARLELPASAKRARIWLEAEYGVRWSMEAIVRDRENKIVRQLRATPTSSNPKTFLAIEVSEGNVMIDVIVTNLSSRTPDADEPDANFRAFQLVADAR